MHTQAGKEMTVGDMTHGGRAADPAITVMELPIKSRLHKKTNVRMEY